MLFQQGDARTLRKLFNAIQKDVRDAAEERPVDALNKLDTAKHAGALADKLGDKEASKLFLFCLRKAETAEVTGKKAEGVVTDPEKLRQAAETGFEKLVQAMNPETRQVLVNARLLSLKSG